MQTEEQQNYVALIVSREHPHAELLAELFDAEAEMYRKHKP